MLEKNASLLRTFERKVLRTIFGPINENGVFRRRYNFELEPTAMVWTYNKLSIPEVQGDNGLRGKRVWRRT